LRKERRERDIERAEQSIMDGMGEVRLACFLSHDGNHSRRRRSSTPKTAPTTARSYFGGARPNYYFVLFGPPRAQRGGERPHLPLVIFAHLSKYDI
jgi:hypothetical protein